MKEEIESKLSPQHRVVVDSLREQLGTDTVNILLEFGYEIGKADGVEMFFQATKDILKEV